MEGLSFTLYERQYGDEISKIYPNKYKNGIDGYNYFKQYKGSQAPIGSTIDGWILRRDGTIELLELKYSENKKYLACIKDFNQYVNPLRYKYFLAIYAQAQAQIENTGVNTCNLYFTMSDGNKRCVVKRNQAFIDYMFNIAYEFLNEFSLYKEIVSNIIANKNEDEYMDSLKEELESRQTKLYKKLVNSSYCYKKALLSYFPRKQVVISEEEAYVLEDLLIQIDTLEKDAQQIMDTVVREKKEKAKILQSLIHDQFPFIDDSGMYQSGDILFTFTTNRYTNILDRLNIIGIHPSVRTGNNKSNEYDYLLSQERLDSVNVHINETKLGLFGLLEEKGYPCSRVVRGFTEYRETLDGKDNAKDIDCYTYKQETYKCNHNSYGCNNMKFLSSIDNDNHDNAGEDDINRRRIEQIKTQIKAHIKEKVNDKNFNFSSNDLYELAEQYRINKSYYDYLEVEDLYLILKHFPLLPNRKDDWDDDINKYVALYLQVKDKYAEGIKCFRERELEKQKEQFNEHGMAGRFTKDRRYVTYFTEGKKRMPTNCED
ncbi:hypothetical protein F0310_05055 (plasmid) [Borrelia sp. A-FGy1]|uniref:hypothetical protein n=1 Tax=Borrelia sp. A-FGy1 TaxID=2608247 RepID=UPI0015F3892C|nr:hypothetical protein [Borrelia sp. A-FGy1]QMU99786.1 hypothetical protein F0310_05055 [Borrelia sp. A-FGy1]